MCQSLFELISGFPAPRASAKLSAIRTTRQTAPAKTLLHMEPPRTPAKAAPLPKMSNARFGGIVVAKAVPRKVVVGPLAAAKPTSQGRVRVALAGAKMKVSKERRTTQAGKARVSKTRKAAKMGPTQEDAKPKNMAFVKAVAPVKVARRAAKAQRAAKRVV
jgi:hypothetical protein